ncbi:hypothetical protein E1I21_02450 [Microbacterium oleivorans]|nr:hypothetical protein E1I21_02450 [Microbacterium oleivorans]
MTTGRSLRSFRANRPGIRFTSADRAPFCCSARHSGQMTPTGSGVWQAGQIVRRHRWQSTKL